MQLIRTLAVSVAVLSGALVPHVAEAQSAPTIYWGAYTSGAPFNTALLDQLEGKVGKKQSIVHWGQPWEMHGAYVPFQTKEYEKVRLRGQIPFINWASYADGGSHKVQPKYTLASIYNGAHDAYITQWAQAAKAWGHPFFIRWGHEMNGNWYAWSEQMNGNKPGDFVKAWRHIVDIFRKVGATNATWVWCVNIVSSETTPLAGLYPGDAYVDWTGIDGYNWGTDRGFKWLWFDQIYGLHPWTKMNTYQQVLSIAPNKPIMVAETATSKDGGDPGAWIKDLMLTQLPQKYTKVKALVWLNWNQNDPALEWPVDSTPTHLAAFKQSVASSHYASGGSFANLPAGPIRALGTSSAPAPTAGTTTVTLPVVADTHTDATHPTWTGGYSRTYLTVDGDTRQTAYLRFDLSSLKGKTITGAWLQIRTTGPGSLAKFPVYFVNSDSWGRSTHHNNRPATSRLLGTFTAPNSASTWYQASLTPSLVQTSVVGVSLSLAITTTSADGMIFSSREAGSALAPRLVVTYK